MPCGVELIQHHGHQGNAGVRQWYNHLDDSKYTHESATSFGYNQATSYTGNAGESCMAVGYSWHQGGKINNSGNPNGDIMTFRNGYHDLQTKWGQQTRTWNDDIDGLRLQSVPSASSSQMQYHINVPEQPQSNMNYFSPRDIKGGTVHDDNGTSFDPCPGASAKYLNSKSGVRCIYPKTASALQTLNSAEKKSNMAAMHTSLAGTFCADSSKVFESPGGQSCLERSTGAALAKTYCQVGSNIKSDPNCTVENMGQTNYDEVAKHIVILLRVGRTLSVSVITSQVVCVMQIPLPLDVQRKKQLLINLLLQHLVIKKMFGVVWNHVLVGFVLVQVYLYHQIQIKTVINR
jgi:hypothetical protein